MILSVVIFSASASKEGIILWRKTGYATSLISSGVTKFLPSMNALILPARTRYKLALGLDPTSMSCFIEFSFGYLVSKTIETTYFSYSFIGIYGANYFLPLKYI